MKPQYWFRWLTMQGMLRMAVRKQARGGDPLAQLLGGAGRPADSFALIDQLRSQGRVARVPVGKFTADHELTRIVLRDNHFGKVPVAGTGGKMAALTAVLARRIPLPANPVEAPSMLVIDPPEHSRMRRPVTSAFTPRATARLRERVEAVTTELLDAFPANGSADLVESFAAQVPSAIITDMLGFPQADRAMFLEWGDHIAPLLDIGLDWRSFRRAFAAQDRMDVYLDTHLQRLRREPGEDILSSLVTSGDLDDRELKATAGLLMAAGFETTVNLIGNCVVRLLENPDQLERLRAEPGLWPNAIEESLRLDAPVQTTARLVLEPFELGDVALREGSLVVVSLAGANRDPAVFEDPHRFDVARENAKDHLSFSSGIHVCLGASLARMEATHAVRALFERFPELRLEGEPKRRETYTLHGYERLPVRLGRAAETSVS
ncbi:cytochrome P450 [Nocardia sp. XZ_19_385]|uniref:cytochrome P450 n=1 Tax=Nocardia sp. XZ_19_385 TaxID=2769488 RepID=UPI00188EAB0C|nr:cytochrome P450 [Nocardia sp. XZ_19_385]